MRCVNCRLSFLCLAGQLDKYTRLSLCPKCGKLNVRLDNTTEYTLVCEKRRMDKQNRLRWADRVMARPVGPREGLPPEVQRDLLVYCESQRRPHLHITDTSLIRGRYEITTCQPCIHAPDSPLREQHLALVSDLDTLREVELHGLHVNLDDYITTEKGG